MHNDERLDLLYELQHDLGKYLCMPLRFLPVGADAQAVQEAVRAALWRTQRRGGEVRSARQLWQEFREALGDGLAGRPSWRVLQQRIDAAFGWYACLEGDGVSWQRELVLHDFEAVVQAIEAVIAELRADGASD